MIKARDNAEAWWLNLKYLSENHYIQDVQRGSFEKTEKRYQVPFLSGTIEHPLYDMVPAVPLGVPAPTSRDYIERYFHKKIIGTERTDNEEYTYGERINEQLPQVIEMLMSTSETNQAVIEVAKPSDIELPDPPCLRCLTFQVVPKNGGKVLNLGCWWRSWDLWSGFPSNMAGLALLMDYVAGFLEDVRVGSLFYASTGAHVYGYEWEYVERVVKR